MIIRRAASLLLLGLLIALNVGCSSIPYASVSGTSNKENTITSTDSDNLVYDMDISYDETDETAVIHELSLSDKSECDPELFKQACMYKRTLRNIQMELIFRSLEGDADLKKISSALAAKFSDPNSKDHYIDYNYEVPKIRNSIFAKYGDDTPENRKKFNNIMLQLHSKKLQELIPAFSKQLHKNSIDLYSGLSDITIAALFTQDFNYRFKDPNYKGNSIFIKAMEVLKEYGQKGTFYNSPPNLPNSQDCSGYVTDVYARLGLLTGQRLTCGNMANSNLFERVSEPRPGDVMVQTKTVKGKTKGHMGVFSGVIDKQGRPWGAQMGGSGPALAPWGPKGWFPQYDPTVIYYRPKHLIQK